MGTTRDDQTSQVGPDWGRLAVAAARTCAAALTPYAGQDWRTVQSRDLDWSVWATLIHVNDDLYFYAAQVLLADPTEGAYICFELSPDAHTTPDRLLDALVVNAGLLAAAVSAATPHSLGYHVYGASDPAGFAAMGVTELLVHTFDAVRALDAGSTWRPPDELTGAVVERLFPEAPRGTGHGAGEVLLHACGRTPLGSRPRHQLALGRDTSRRRATGAAPVRLTVPHGGVGQILRQHVLPVTPRVALLGRPTWARRVLADRPLGRQRGAHLGRCPGAPPGPTSRRIPRHRAPDSRP